MTKEMMLERLKKDVVPALGCTEPVCVAITAADAVVAVGGEIQKIDVIVNPNIYKNGMSVGIPGFDKVGLEYAAALGAYIGKPETKLELLKGLTPEIADKARALVDKGLVKVTIDWDKKKIYVASEVTTDKGVGYSLIRDAHTNVVLTKANGKELWNAHYEEGDAGTAFTRDPLLDMTVKEMRQVADSLSEEELAFLLDGISMNDEVAAYGLSHECGVGIADTIEKDRKNAFLGDSLTTDIMMKVASSIEARLDGCPTTVMSSAGAGSKGLALILPVSMVAKQAGASREALVKALAFGHMLNSYINGHIGKLSAMCTCAVAAATASSAAMTWLMGGNDEQIGWAIRNMTGTVSGMICDGGKVGCAMKLSMASSAALLSARMAVNGAVLRVSDGICGRTPEECIANLARLGDPGMLTTDREILGIMLEKADTI